MSLDSGSHSELLPENQALPHSCPYLGLSNDLTSRYGYPHSRNCCHRVKPSQPVGLDQQSGVCLGGSQAYQNCPVNNDAWKGALPDELADDEPAALSRPRWHYYAAAGLVLVILLVVGLVIFIPFRPSVTAPLVGMLTPTPFIFDTASPTVEMMASATENAPVVAVSSTPLSPPTGLSTMAAAPTSTAIPPTATNTRTPTSTATPKPPTATTGQTQTAIPTSLTPALGPGLETPLGPKGKYTIHLFSVGETLEGLAAKYQTTIEVIRVINQPRNQSLIWGGTPLVIVVGEVDVKNVRPLQAIWLDINTRLSYLAEKYATPIDELLQLNGLGVGDTAPGQRWMVVWRN